MKKNQYFAYSLGDLEKEVMAIIWQKGIVTCRDVVSTMDVNKPDKQPAYTTIATILNRLTMKGILVRSIRNNTGIYRATKSKDEFVSEATMKMMKNFVETFGNVALVHFVEEAKKIDKGKLKKIINEIKYESTS